MVGSVLTRREDVPILVASPDVEVAGGVLVVGPGLGEGEAGVAIAGYVDYQRREFCKDVACPVQVLLDGQEPGSSGYEGLRAICMSDCIHSTYEFHHWLIEKGYLVVRPE